MRRNRNRIVVYFIFTTNTWMQNILSTRPYHKYAVSLSFAGLIAGKKNKNINKYKYEKNIGYFGSIIYIWGNRIYVRGVYSKVLH